MIDYIEAILTQVSDLEEADSQTTLSIPSPPSLGLSIPISYEGVTPPQSNPVDGDTHSLGLHPEDREGSPTAENWVEDWADSWWTALGFGGVSYPLTVTQKGSDSEGIPSTVTPSTPSGSSHANVQALYETLVGKQWQSQVMVGGATQTQSPTPDIQHKGRTPILSTTPSPSATLSGMTVQSLDTLVARDARRYDGGFILY